MDNPLAGAGAIEVGGLGEGLQTDIYLASIWTVSLEGVQRMASVMGDARVERAARAIFEKARARIEDAFWLDAAGIYAFALLQGPESGTGAGRQVRTNDALTMWPATAMTFGLLDPGRSARMLPRLSSSLITTDWGTRMLSREHPLYESQHYNNGTVWDFVTGFVAQAHYRYHRSWAGYDLVRDVARTSFDFAPGRNPELMSGAFYRPLDTAVPQQFFATSMLVSPLVRGLLGWSPDAHASRATLAPHLPAAWDSVTVENLPMGASRLRVSIARRPDTYRLRLERSGDSRPLTVAVSPALPLGATVEAVTVDGAAARFTTEATTHDVHATVEVALGSSATVEIRSRGGMEVVAPDERLDVGDASHALRVLDFRRDGNAYVIDVEGLAGREYELELIAGAGVETGRLAITGADRVAAEGERLRLQVRLPAGAVGYVKREIRVGG
jgi:hypothetical protein